MTVQQFFYVIAVVLFGVAAFLARKHAGWALTLIAAGLAVWLFTAAVVGHIAD